ncbi:MAG TPA: efflux RND transporter periplasmic adaptor subunit [Caulobacteraceae bacterium]|jgi:HlyD family secretion protein|nr:efflux RND transporter periplasmic adaptor subunit [Caulobacteraceae bacterium]
MTALYRRPAAWLATGGLIAAAAAGVALTHGSLAHAAKPHAAAPIQSPYAAVAAGRADVEGGVIQVAARTAGIVREVRVDEGDRVFKGQVLARQEDDAPRLAVQTAQASLAQARALSGTTRVQLSAAQRELERLQSLGGVVSRQQVDQGRDAVETAQATLASQTAAVAVQAAALGEARFRLEETIVRAPVDGVIVRRYANPGVGASTLNVTPMFDLEPAGAHIVRAEVPESELPAMRLGQGVRISSESDQSHLFAGTVLREAAVFGARKLQSDDPSERTDERVVEVVVSADNAPFLVGQRVLVRFMR